MAGSIWMSRDVRQSWVWEEAKYYKAWSAMLFLAAFKPTKLLRNGKFFHVARGEFVASRKYLAEITSLTEQELRTFIAKLKKDRAIVVNPTKKATKIPTKYTIVNYDKYQTLTGLPPSSQPVEQPRKQPKANQEPTKNQPAKEERKEIKEVQETSTPLPPKGESSPKKKPTKFNPKSIPLPATLTNLLPTWELWCSHREDIKKPLTKRSAEMTLKKGAEMGAARFKAAIEHSVANGWTGLHEPDAKQRAGPNGYQQKTKGELNDDYLRRLHSKFVGGCDDARQDDEAIDVSPGPIPEPGYQ